MRNRMLLPQHRKQHKYDKYTGSREGQTLALQTCLCTIAHICRPLLDWTWTFTRIWRQLAFSDSNFVEVDWAGNWQTLHKVCRIVHATGQPGYSWTYWTVGDILALNGTTTDWTTFSSKEGPIQSSIWTKSCQIYHGSLVHVLVCPWPFLLLFFVTWKKYNYIIMLKFMTAIKGTWVSRYSF